MCRVLRLSGSFRLRESLIDQLIELGIHAIQGSAEREGQDGVVGREHGDGRSEDPRLKPGKQSGDLPAVGCKEITVGAGWPEDEAFEPQTTQIVGHLTARVFADSDAE